MLFECPSRKISSYDARNFFKKNSGTKYISDVDLLATNGKVVERDARHVHTRVMGSRE